MVVKFKLVIAAQILAVLFPNFGSLLLRHSTHFFFAEYKWRHFHATDTGRSRLKRSISHATYRLLQSRISFTQKGPKMSNYFHIISSERKIGAANTWKEKSCPRLVGSSTRKQVSQWRDRQSIWKYGGREEKAYLICKMTLHIRAERSDEVEPKDPAECEKAHFKKWCKLILTTCWNTSGWVWHCSQGRTRTQSGGLRATIQCIDMYIMNELY